MALNHLSFTPFSGVGIVQMFERNATTGALGVGNDLGESAVFKIGKNVPTAEMNTSRTPDRGVAFRMAQSKVANVEIQVKTLTDFVEGLVHNGVWTETAAGVSQPWTGPAAIEVGQVIKLPARNLTAMTITDSTGSPKTLPPAQYDYDPVGGTIRLLDVTTGGPYALPFKGTCTAGAIKTLGALKATDTEWGVQFNGTNAYDGSRKIVDGFRFRFAAEGDSDFIMESFGTWTIKGALLKDETKAASSAGGQYYAIYRP